MNTTLADELLTAVRTHLQRPDVSYVEAPVHLSGGYFTENHAFRLAGAPPPWDGELVVRLFPPVAPSDLARREAAVQTTLSEQGYPAPAIVFFDDGARLTGRRFFVMARMPGRAMLGAIALRDIASSGGRLLLRLPSVTASLQAWLHRLEVEPLLERLGDAPAGIERWFEELEEQAASRWDGLQPALRWLVDHRPPPVARPALCHGDLHPGNILSDGDRVTAVLDYSVATVAEPCLDVGFTTMSLCIAPITAAPAVQLAVARAGRGIARRYVRAYQRETGADLTNQPYFEALRCLVELGEVVDYRLAEAGGAPHDVPRPTWDGAAKRMLGFFRQRTGVTPSIPSRVP
jgi:aminoglycoside phosphotransferase (APT) family kinase protein